MWWKIMSSATWLSSEWSFVRLLGEWTSCCDVDAVDVGDGGVCLGVVPLHCISRRICSARQISAANHDGNSGRTWNYSIFFKEIIPFEIFKFSFTYFKADLRPSIMCSSVTISMIVWVVVSPGHSRVTWPDNPINAQLTITAASPIKLKAFCHVPILATRCPNGRCSN